MNYKRIYDQVIDRAKSRRHINEYIERHHIVPRCLGGSDDITNIAYLTPEEHYVCHLLLVKLYPNHRGLLTATLLLSDLNSDSVSGRATNKVYGWVKRRLYSTVKRKIINPDCICQSPSCTESTSRFRLYCSVNCRQEVKRSNKGEVRAFKCLYCGVSFKDSYERKYCTADCYKSSKRSSLSALVELKCEVCHRSFQCPARVASKRKCCSLSCGAKRRHLTTISS